MKLIFLLFLWFCNYPRYTYTLVIWRGWGNLGVAPPRLPQSAYFLLQSTVLQHYPKRFHFITTYYQYTTQATYDTLSQLNPYYLLSYSEMYEQCSLLSHMTILKQPDWPSL